MTRVRGAGFARRPSAQSAVAEDLKKRFASCVALLSLWQV